MRKELVKITVRVYAEDMDLIRMAYANRGYNNIIRSLVARHARRLKNAVNAVVPASDPAVTEKLTLEELDL